MLMSEKNLSDKINALKNLVLSWW